MHEIKLKRKKSRFSGRFQILFTDLTTRSLVHRALRSLSLSANEQQLLDQLLLRLQRLVSLASYLPVITTFLLTYICSLLLEYVGEKGKNEIYKTKEIQK